MNTRSRGRNRVVTPPVTRSREILIAHSSPSIRVILALELIDERPVLMANGPIGLLHQLESIADGTVIAPRAIVVGERELSTMAREGWLNPLARARIRVILVAHRRSSHDRAGPSCERACVDEVRDILAA